MLAMKNKSIAMAIVFEILLKTVNISGHNIFMKIKYLSFSIGSYSEVYLATVCDWRAGGDLSAPVPHTDLETTTTSSYTSSFNFDQVFIKAPGLLSFTVCVCGKGQSKRWKLSSPLCRRCEETADDASNATFPKNFRRTGNISALS